MKAEHYEKHLISELRHVYIFSFVFKKFTISGTIKFDKTKGDLPDFLKQAKNAVNEVFLREKNIGRKYIPPKDWNRNKELKKLRINKFKRTKTYSFTRP